MSISAKWVALITDSEFSYNTSMKVAHSVCLS